MARLGFEWDERKAATNLRKHGVSFREAITVFYDDRARLIDDPDHSESERRLVLLGRSFADRVLAVHHTIRVRARTIRLISARRATRAERAQYQHRWKS